MQTITFTCETITPMFLAGADGTTPELRAPSIKGALRFWWRAMNGHLSLNTLQEKESEIFGGTDNGGSKSKVSIAIYYEDEDLKENILPNDEREWGQKGSSEKIIKETYNLNWNEGNKQGDHEGIGYLLYSALFQNHRPFIKDKFKFDITFRSKDKAIIEKTVACFWLFIHFGGIGTRNRRAGGCLSAKIKSDPFDIISSMKIEFGQSINTIESYIQNNFIIVKSHLRVSQSGTSIRNDYSNLEDFRIILSNKGENSWVNSLKTVSQKFRTFRQRNKGSVWNTPIFGLPISHRNPKSQFTIADKGLDRRSSPLLFKVVKFNQDYYWLVLSLNGEFLPYGKKLMEKESRVTNYPNNSQMKILFDNCWQELKTANGSEYTIKI